MSGKHKRVLLLFSYHDYRLTRGVERFAEECGWAVSRDVYQEHGIPWGWKGDGIVSWLGAGDEMADFVASARIPAIDFGFHCPQLKIPRVLFDNAQIGQLTADHFILRGFSNFVFCSDDDRWNSNERGAAFRDALARAGHGCTCLSWTRSSAYRPGGQEQWQRKQEWLESELIKAPKPLGVFAAVDALAADVLEVCQNAGLAVPDEVAIAGVDNSLTAVDYMEVPLTTVDPNWENVGYHGAALLNALMDGADPPLEPIRMPPAGLIPRKSTDPCAVAHEGIARSLRFMAQHYAEPVRISDLARVAGMSIRSYEQAVRSHIGRSPGNEIRRLRIDQARRLLTDPAQKAEAVAESCGFRTYNNFWTSFRKTTGMSPSQYRERFSITVLPSRSPLASPAG